MRDPATESCVCPDGFTPRPELGICEGPDGSVIRYDAGPWDAGLDAPDQPDTGLDSGIDSCVERTFFRDADEDGFGNPDVSESACVAPEGFVEDATDCDDDCETCFTGRTEVCDERDNDCDGVSDEGVVSTFYRDMDGDTFGDPTMSVQACAAPAGYVANDDDCNDDCAQCRPGGTEVCEGSLDENCSMGVDEGCACTNGMMRACPGGTDVGACVAGTQTCTVGAWGACMGALTNVAEISAGPDSGLGGGHTCVRRTDGGVWCWGKNDRGQIGDGTMENRLVPVMVLSGASHVAVGGDHSCAVTANGGVRCWGNNVRSQLGEGTTVDRSTPFATTAP